MLLSLIYAFIFIVLVNLLKNTTKYFITKKTEVDVCHEKHISTVSQVRSSSGHSLELTPVASS